MVLFLFSCSEDEAIVSPTSRVSHKSDVYLENDYLVFSNHKVFKEALVYSNPKIVEKYNEWESIEGFTSLNQIYNQALLEQSKYNGQDFCPFVSNNKNSFVFNEDGSFDVNMFYSPFRRLVNGKGIVKVEDVIYQFTRDKVKFILGDNLSKLLRATNDDLENKLYVRDVVNKTFSKNINTKTAGSWGDNLHGSGSDTDPDLYNRVLAGVVKQNHVIVAHYDPETDEFVDYVPISSLYCQINYYKGKTGKAISSSTKWTVGLILKVALKVVGVSTGISFGWDLIAENLRKNYIEETPASVLLISYDTDIANGYNTFSTVNSELRRDTGGFGFYISVPDNSTSQPDGFYMLNGTFSFFSEENVDGVNRRLRFELSYPNGDIIYAGTPEAF